MAQSYEVEADNEYVIRGNSAVMKCEVPSFVADFVSVEMWVDSAGRSYRPDTDYGNPRETSSTLLHACQPKHVVLISLGLAKTAKISQLYGKKFP